MGFLVNKFKLNKVLVWSIANLLVGVCGIVVTYTEDVNSVIILGALTGKILKVELSVSLKRTLQNIIICEY